MTLCSSDNPEDKLRFCFRSLDVDNSGYLDRKEILYAVELIFKHNVGLEKRVAPDVNSPEKVVSKIFEHVDKNGDNKLTADELIDFMHNDPKTFSYLGLNLIFLT
jgi:Ca2+-binding EF-hand superfamily protein